MQIKKTMPYHQIKWKQDGGQYSSISNQDSGRAHYLWFASGFIIADYIKSLQLEIGAKVDVELTFGAIAKFFQRLEYVIFTKIQDGCNLH